MTKSYKKFLKKDEKSFKKSCLSLHPRPFADLTGVTLADEDSNSIPTDDANKAVLGNVAMQVAPSGGQQ